MHKLNKSEMEYIRYINKKTRKANKDNISRTMTYQNFYRKFPEIKWAFLASMVSRNAGWNMTDLMAEPFLDLLPNRTRKQLFSTYERANWLIFSDAYPQLMLYQISTYLNRPMFHLLPYFDVSTFMIKEWCHFWQKRDKERLIVALIINEQNVIVTPVTKQPFYKWHVFMNWPYLLQDFFHMSTVLFPTRSGEICAMDVHDFSNTTKRITLGKRLAHLLFRPDKFDQFYDFALNTEHTGSRRDYGRYLKNAFGNHLTPMLRSVYPIINHQDNIRYDWFFYGGIKEKWWQDEKASFNQTKWESYCRKREMMLGFEHIKQSIRRF
ncbi:DUF2515 domain-containing protein [Aquibacillus koreensis]|uniref:DUF2515 domain-containing protein n=1 Tax=Aquibacillus koreensis TaxID=279446 RepID=A0A9X4AI05_9BACI|nr:DUF2515 domain-containing protein [Aquibacillus koreensis]MCT2537347.1 DUF2515 domain-containing protein [Aquibacillus koreensis]MDC3418793.1 DUF2515 domain-containing protein [Aquibacillus koreensis]